MQELHYGFATIAEASITVLPLVNERIGKASTDRTAKPLWLYVKVHIFTRSLQCRVEFHM